MKKLLIGAFAFSALTASAALACDETKEAKAEPWSEKYSWSAPAANQSTATATAEKKTHKAKASKKTEAKKSETALASVTK